MSEGATPLTDEFERPVCACDEFWPKQGHHPECPVGRRFADLERELAEARTALEWYGEQARLARLIHAEGDAGRQAIAHDGGKKAREALARIDSPDTSITTTNPHHEKHEKVLDILAEVLDDWRAGLSPDETPSYQRAAALLQENPKP